MTRPDPEKRWKAKEHPLEFDRLLEALGAEVVDYRSAPIAAAAT